MPYSSPPFIKTSSQKNLNRVTVESGLRSYLYSLLLMKLFPDPPFNKAEIRHNRLIELYDSEIRRSDRAIRKIVEAIDAYGLMDRTLFIVMADHGEAFKEHGYFQHKSSVYQEQIKIPMIIASPMVKRPGATVSCPVSVIDVMPTILEATARRDFSDLSGLSLWQVIDSGICQDRPLFAELDLRSMNGNLYEAVLRNNMKLIRTTRGDQVKLELFDLSLDHGETDNLASSLPEVTRELQNALDHMMAGRSLLAEQVIDLDVRDLQDKLMKSMGYLR